jgi:hypothetical protein
MTPEEVEAEFGIERRYQETLRDRKAIPYHKLNPGRSGRVMYDRRDVEEFLSRTRVPAAC